jgi:hypothetical protein
MPLPNAENAFIDTRKLTDYCLNLEHFEGRHKARVFKSALNIELCNVDKLQAALKEAAKNQPAVPTQRNQYGQKYVIDFMMINLDKHALVRSVWIVRHAEGFPRLVTCYVL